MTTGSEGSPTSPSDRLRGWFTGRMPSEWFASAPEITLDREEISIIGALATPALPGIAPGLTGEPH